MPHKGHEGAELTPGAINQCGSSADHCDPRVRVEKCDLLAETIGKRDIVCILPGDIYSMGELQRMIQRLGNSLVGLLKKDDPAIGIASGDLGRSIGRSIVYDDELEVFKGLAQDTVDA